MHQDEGGGGGEHYRIVGGRPTQMLDQAPPPPPPHIHVDQSSHSQRGSCVDREGAMRTGTDRRGGVLNSRRWLKQSGLASTSPFPLCLNTLVKFQAVAARGPGGPGGPGEGSRLTMRGGRDAGGSPRSEPVSCASIARGE